MTMRSHQQAKFCSKASNAPAQQQQVWYHFYLNSLSSSSARHQPVPFTVRRTKRELSTLTKSFFVARKAGCRRLTAKMPSRGNIYLSLSLFCHCTHTLHNAMIMRLHRSSGAAADARQWRWWREAMKLCWFAMCKLRIYCLQPVGIVRYDLFYCYYAYYSANKSGNESLVTATPLRDK